MSLDVYGVGNALVDIQAQVDDQLLETLGFEKGIMTLVDEATQQRVLNALDSRPITRCAGGSAANTVIAVADFGGKACYAGKVSRDALGQFCLRDMRQLGVEIEVPPGDGQTGTSVILITAQRLARRLCVNCKAPADIPHETLLEAGFKEEEVDGSWTPYRPVGCSMCNNGYKGRVGIYQVMPISEEIQRIILRDGSSMEIAEQAQREGVRSLRQSGLHKVRMGMTSLEEVLGCTNE